MNNLCTNHAHVPVKPGKTEKTVHSATGLQLEKQTSSRDGSRDKGGRPESRLKKIHLRPSQN